MVEGHRNGNSETSIDFRRIEGQRPGLLIKVIRNAKLNQVKAYQNIDPGLQPSFRIRKQHLFLLKFQRWPSTIAGMTRTLGPANSGLLYESSLNIDFNIMKRHNIRRISNDIVIYKYLLNNELCRNKMFPYSISCFWKRGF
jgi:hypothetical protein